MQSGRGTGPMTPRQPVAPMRRSNGQVPIPAPTLGRGKMRRALDNFGPFSFWKGLFYCPNVACIDPRYLGAIRSIELMEKTDGFMRALKCRECGREYPLTATHVCEFDFGPLEVVFDYDRIKTSLTREALQSRAKSMWRYRELLPVQNDPTVGFEVGFTPLIKADQLARRLGVRELWVKNDTVNYPTLSFKDRVVSVALSRARELGFNTVACASTGNLANSVAANAAA